MHYHLQSMKGQRHVDKANINEPLDLQEATRRDDVYRDLNEIIDKLEKIPVFPSLMWVWAFDIIKEIFDNYQIKDLAVNDYVDEGVPEGITLKQIFDKFWADVDGFGLSMDSGGDIIEETIRDWMRDNDFLVSLEEEDDE